MKYWIALLAISAILAGCSNGFDECLIYNDWSCEVVEQTDTSVTVLLTNLLGEPLMIRNIKTQQDAECSGPNTVTDTAQFTCTFEEAPDQIDLEFGAVREGSDVGRITVARIQ